MIEFETLLFLLIIGIVSLIATIYLFFTGKKVEIERTEKDIGEVKVLKTQIKLVPFIYLMIILILFIIGIFSDFIFNSVIGIVFASIPFLAYLIFDYREGKFMRKK